VRTNTTQSGLAVASADAPQVKR